MYKDFDKGLMDLIKKRRSVRIFNGEKIAKDDVLSIIEAATWAPTGCNNQELRLLVLDEKSQLEEFLKFKPFLKGVSTVVLVFCDMSLPMSHKMYCEYKHERHLPYVDTGLALADMVLYAKAKGIDSCIVNLSKYHFRRSGEKRITKRLIGKINCRLGLYDRVKNNFEFYLRNHLKLPHHLAIMCGMALGFAEKYPDVNTFKHGGRGIMRQPVNHHMISK